MDGYSLHFFEVHWTHTHTVTIHYGLLKQLHSCSVQQNLCTSFSLLRKRLLILDLSEIIQMIQCNSLFNYHILGKSLYENYEVVRSQTLKAIVRTNLYNIVKYYVQCESFSAISHQIFAQYLENWAVTDNFMLTNIDQAWQPSYSQSYSVTITSVSASESVILALYLLGIESIPKSLLLPIPTRENPHLPLENRQTPHRTATVGSLTLNLSVISAHQLSHFLIINCICAH